MIKFNNNNNISSVIDLTLFYINKNFYSYISFDLDFISYKITRKRLEAIKTKNISLKIKKLLKYN